MYKPLTYDREVERAIHEFEADYEHYRAADRRNMVVGVLVFLFGLFSACVVFGGIYFLIR